MNKQKSKNKIKFSSLLARLGVGALGLYLVVSLVVSQVEIVAKRHELNSVKTSLQSQVAENDEIKRVLDSGNEDDYIERVARDKLGYARQDERIFQDTTGK